MNIYKVGGCVRDQLMGIPPRDVDWLVVGATPSDLEAKGYIRVGADFPVFLHPETKEEYALARRERKTSAGHKGFQTVFDPSVTLEQDLSRRDLTVNAMAIDAQSGALIDPHGGQADLASKTLRHVSDAFSEDPLRVLRLARLQARTGFDVNPGTMALCKEICASGALRELSPERVCQELRKLLESPDCSRGMETLRDCGALAALDPGWPARLDLPRLGALAQAARGGVSEGDKARLAFCQGLSPAQSEAFMELLRFPSDMSKACMRLGSFVAWANSIDPARPDPEGSCQALERCGAHRMSAHSRSSFALAASEELKASGCTEERLGWALAALEAAPAIAAADLSGALALSKLDIPHAVRLAKSQAFAKSWLSFVPAGHSAAPTRRMTPF